MITATIKARSRRTVLLVMVGVFALAGIATILSHRQAGAAVGDHHFDYTIGHPTDDENDDTGGIKGRGASIAHDGKGFVYVLDPVWLSESDADGSSSTYSYIRKYKETGEYVESIKVRTGYSGNVQWWQVCSSEHGAMDIDAQGNIYIFAGMQCGNMKDGDTFRFVKYPPTGGDPVFLAPESESNLVYPYGGKLDPTKSHAYIFGGDGAYRYKLDGTSPTLILGEDHINVEGIAFAPNGDIWYSGSLDDYGSDGPWVVWKTDANGQNLEKIIKVEQGQSGDSDHSYASLSSIAIDGQGTVYLHGVRSIEGVVAESWTLWKVDASGQNPTLIADVAELPPDSAGEHMVVDSVGNVYVLGSGQDNQVVRVYTIERSSDETDVTPAPDNKPKPPLPKVPDTGAHGGDSLIGTLMIMLGGAIALMILGIIYVRPAKR